MADQDFWQSILQSCGDESVPRNTELIDISPSSEDLNIVDDIFETKDLLDPSDSSLYDKLPEIEISSPRRLMSGSLNDFNSLQIHADNFTDLLFQDNKQLGVSVGSFESGAETAAAAAIRSDESIGSFNHNLCPPSNILQPDKAIDYIFRPPSYNSPAMHGTLNAVIYAVSSAPSCLIHHDYSYFNSSWNEGNNSTAISTLCAQTRAGDHQRDKITDITLNELSHYFNMPIIQAAKELKVGLPVLKKRCREFGIARWPYRKMKSLENLIHNIQELGKNDGELSNAQLSSAQLRNAVQILEDQKRLMEEMPGIELAEKTKRLRQAWFKASYKKRRQMAIESANTGVFEGSTS